MLPFLFKQNCLRFAGPFIGAAAVVVPFFFSGVHKLLADRGRRSQGAGNRYQDSTVSSLEPLPSGSRRCSSLPLPTQPRPEFSDHAPPSHSTRLQISNWTLPPPSSTTRCEKTFGRRRRRRAGKVGTERNRLVLAWCGSGRGLCARLAAGCRGQFGYSLVWRIPVHHCPLRIKHTSVWRALMRADC